MSEERTCNGSKSEPRPLLQRIERIEWNGMGLIIERRADIANAMMSSLNISK